jgi:hypothetical protein
MTARRQMRENWEGMILLAGEWSSTLRDPIAVLSKSGGQAHTNHTPSFDSCPKLRTKNMMFLTWPAAVRIFGLHAQSNTRSLLGELLAILGLLGVQTPGRVFWYTDERNRSDDEGTTTRVGASIASGTASRVF